MLKIKACKKLRVSFDKIKASWKLCHKNTIIEDPIVNGELCVIIRGESKRSSNLLVDENNIKIMYCPYSLVALQNSINVSNQKTIQKKQNKKGKQDATKVARNSITNLAQMDI